MANILLKLHKMRKPQKFTIYPVSENDQHFIVQSKSRIGCFHLETGEGVLSVNCSNGAYFHHLSDVNGAFDHTIAPLDLQAVRMLVFAAGEKYDLPGGSVEADNSKSNLSDGQIHSKS
jgi:hypothetical protein